MILQQGIQEFEERLIGGFALVDAIHALFPAHQDAPQGIYFRIPGVDSDTSKARDVQNVGHVLAEGAAVVDDDFVSPGWDGSLAVDLSSPRLTNGILQRVADVLSV